MITAFADKRLYVGDKPGLAQVCKLVNNAISLTSFVVPAKRSRLELKAGSTP